MARREIATGILVLFGLGLLAVASTAAEDLLRLGGGCADYNELFGQSPMFAFSALVSASFSLFSAAFGLASSERPARWWVVAVAGAFGACSELLFPLLARFAQNDVYPFGTSPNAWVLVWTQELTQYPGDLVSALLFGDWAFANRWADGLVDAPVASSIRGVTNAAASTALAYCLLSRSALYGVARFRGWAASRG